MLKQRKEKQPPTIKELRAICRPNIDKNGVSVTAFYEIHNPWLSIYLTWAFIRFNISANAVTALMLVVSVIATAFLLPDNYWLHIVAVVLYMFSYLLDWSDGEVARYFYHTHPEKKKTNYLASAVGTYLDKLYHHLTSIFLIMGIGVSSFLHYDEILILLLGTATALLLAIKLFVKYSASSTILSFFANEDTLSFQAENAHKFATTVYLPEKNRRLQRLTGNHGMMKFHGLLLAILLGPLAQTATLALYGLYQIFSTVRMVLTGGTKTAKTEFNRFILTETGKRHSESGDGDDDPVNN